MFIAEALLKKGHKFHSLTPSCLWLL